MWPTHETCAKWQKPLKKKYGAPKERGPYKALWMVWIATDASLT